MKFIINESQYVDLILKRDLKLISEQGSIARLLLGLTDDAIRIISKDIKDLQSVKKFIKDTGRTEINFLNDLKLGKSSVQNYVSSFGRDILKSKTLYNSQNNLFIKAADDYAKEILQSKSQLAVSFQKSNKQQRIQKLRNAGYPESSINTIIQKIDNLEKPIIPYEKFSNFAKDVGNAKKIYIERYGEESYKILFNDYIKGKYNKDTFLKILKQAEKPNPKMADWSKIYSLSFTKTELKDINSLMNVMEYLYKSPTTTKLAFGFVEPKILINTKKGAKYVTIKATSVKEANEMAKKYGWATNFDNTYGFALDSSVYLITDNIKKLSLGDFKQLIWHELTHIKDPAKISKKLEVKYHSGGRNDKRYFTKDYYFHQKEILANTTKILNGLNDNTKKIMKSWGKYRTIKALNDIKLWSTQPIGTVKFSQDMNYILGFNNPFVSEHFKNLLRKPKELMKLNIKVANQADYLIKQVKLSL